MGSTCHPALYLSLECLFLFFITLGTIQISKILGGNLTMYFVGLFLFMICHACYWELIVEGMLMKKKKKKKKTMWIGKI